MADDVDRAQAAIEGAMARALTGRAPIPRGNAGGVCASCGDAISAARLAVMPGAARCLDCQEQYEGAAWAAR